MTGFVTKVHYDIDSSISKRVKDSNYHFMVISYIKNLDD